MSEKINYMDMIKNPEKYKKEDKVRSVTPERSTPSNYSTVFNSKSKYIICLINRAI